MVTVIIPTVILQLAVAINNVKTVAPLLLTVLIVTHKAGYKPIVIVPVHTTATNMRIKAITVIVIATVLFATVLAGNLSNKLGLK